MYNPAPGRVGGAIAYLGGATAYLAGVLDGIKAISAQLGLGSGMSLAILGIGNTYSPPLLLGWYGGKKFGRSDSTWTPRSPCRSLDKTIILARTSDTLLHHQSHVHT